MDETIAPDMVPLSFRIDADLHKRLLEARKKYGTNVSLFIRQAIDAKLTDLGIPAQRDSE